MDYYKKKKITYNSDVRRELRHAETVKARESSRFKRLSMLRAIDEEQPSFEKPIEKKKEEVKKPVSRLEILSKWKHERIIRKELEKKNSIRPFYAGAPSLKSTNTGVSKIVKCSQASGNLSSTSTKVPSCNSSLVSRIPNTSKQASSCSSNQNSRVPNSLRQASACAAVTSTIPNGSKLIGIAPKTTKNIQPQLQRIPSSNRELSKKPIIFGNNLKTKQTIPRSKAAVSSPAPSVSGLRSTKGFQSQTGISCQASSLSGSSSTKGFQSRIAKPFSVVPNRIPVQSKLPISNNQKPNGAVTKKIPSVLPVASKLPASSYSQKSASGLVKKSGHISKVDLKKAPFALRNQKQEKKTYPESTENKNKGATVVEEIMSEDNNVEPTCSEDCKSESGSDRNIESLSEIFHCDVSIINRAPSFAPADFKFQPPAEILDSSFDFSILRKIKEFTSRTSTPSKQHFKGTKSDKEDAIVFQKPSENEEIEINKSTSSKCPAESDVIDENNKEIIRTPSGNADVKTNISTPSKDHAQVCENAEDDKETLQEPSGKVDIEVHVPMSKQSGQGSKSDEDLIAIMQMSTENVKIETNISSPSKDPVQDSENLPSETNLQDSTQSPCHSKVAIDEERLLKDLEGVKAELNSFELPLNKIVDRQKYRESILSNAIQKRRSILKKSTLNSIAESEDFLVLSPDSGTENKENVFVTPRRSRRISKLISIDESPSSTPRRSLRLQGKLSKSNQLDGSNYGGKTNLTNDFGKLTLEDFDNMDPKDYLCDFDDSPQTVKSKKISLLYSPEKRKSIRRSIKGDLMSFSPINSPRK